MPFQLIGTKEGVCPLCRGKAAKDKELFVVKGPYSGAVCGEHLYVLASNGKPEESPLQDSAQ